MPEWNVLNSYQERRNDAPLLYLQRPPLYFKETEGEVMEFSPLPEILQKPLLVAESETDNVKIKGKESGRRYIQVEHEGNQLILEVKRSGLILIGNKLYRLKGSNPSDIDFRTDPFGGQILEIAEVEISYTNELSSIFGQMNIETPSIPVGSYKYQVTYNGKTCVATIYEVKGDTRVDEFLMDKEQHLLAIEYMSGNPVQEIESLSDIFYRFGVQAGSLLRIINEHNITWNRITKIYPGNAHIGNYVIFEGKPGETFLGIVDLDAATTWRDKTDMDRVRRSDIRKLINGTRKIESHSHSVRMPKIEGRKTTPYRTRFVDGFKSGYRNPSIKPIPTEDVAKALEDFSLNYVRNFLEYTRGIRDVDGKFKEDLQRLSQALEFI